MAPKRSCYVLDECTDVVQTVDFCPLEGSAHIVAYSTTNRVCIASCKFPEEDPDLDDIEYEIIRDFHHDSRVTAFAWSPTTSLVSFPKTLSFFTGGTDRKIYAFSSDLADTNKRLLIGEHQNYINSIAVQPGQGEQLASVSDDLTCKVWTKEGREVLCLPLTSPGMSVCWHAERPEKLMVAEKKGLIRFYNVLSQQTVMSLDCGCVPLMSADWCPSNVLLVACVAGSDTFVFDTSQSSTPLENKMVHAAGATQVRWSLLQRHLLATSGQPNSQIKVWNLHSNQTPLTQEHVISNDLSWHHHLPILAVGGDRKVYFYKIDIL